MILNNYTSFLDKFFEKLNDLKIDISKYQLDHIAYQASSDQEYDKIKPELQKLGEYLDENLVANRRVSLFRLFKPLEYKNYSIPALELVAPLEGQECPSALEHAEFVIDENFDSFMQKYPSIDWNTSSIDHPVFPMLKLKLDKYIQVKFHYKPVLDIVNKK